MSCSCSMTWWSFLVSSLADSRCSSLADCLAHNEPSDLKFVPDMLGKGLSTCSSQQCPNSMETMTDLMKALSYSRLSLHAQFYRYCSASTSDLVLQSWWIWVTGSGSLLVMTRINSLPSHSCSSEALEPGKAARPLLSGCLTGSAEGNTAWLPGHAQPADAFLLLFAVHTRRACGGRCDAGRCGRNRGGR